MDELSRRREQRRGEPVVEDVIAGGPTHGPYSIEERPVGPNTFVSIYTTGRHDSRCSRTEYGWICHSSCQVSDMPQANVRRTGIEQVFGHERIVRSWWLGLFARWRVERIVRLRVFTNGRCMLDSFKEVPIEIGSGRSLTSRGARREMERVIGSDVVEWVQPG